MNVLVTGGAGYIGSHTCKILASHSHKPVTVDHLLEGHEWAVQWGPLYKVDIVETSRLVEIMLQEEIEAVVHFAAFAAVGESVLNPLKYYHNNVVGSLSLLRAMNQAQVKKIVFSSTCATYGMPSNIPIEESEAQKPINPYGQTKLITEEILKDFVRAYGIEAIALRYFNASGADAEGKIGEDHSPETHLIPLVLDAAIGRRPSITIFGTDYPTADGTCIRDYIHVLDLAEAHVLALKCLKGEACFKAYNLGTGTGISVKNIISEVERITGKKIAVEMGQRRQGDPPVLVASGQKAQSELGWEPRNSSLENIISTAAKWHFQYFGKQNG